MSGFSHYLLALFAGQKRWHLVVCVILLAQLAFSAWGLVQKTRLDNNHMDQLLAFSGSSAHLSRHAVALSQLKLSALAKLSQDIERYQQQLDALRPYYTQNQPGAWQQSFQQLDVIWQPIREAAEELLSYSEKLSALRSAVEETDQHLPEVLTQHDGIIDGLHSLVSKPASLKLLREQRLILHRMAANINAVTAGVLSGVDANARSAISSSIESDLFLLEKSVGLMVTDNKEAISEAEKTGVDVSLLIQIDGVAEQLSQLTASVRKVIESLSVIREVNKSSQLLVEDSGLLLKPSQELVAYQKYASQGFSVEKTWLVFSFSALLFWLFYMGFQRLNTASHDAESMQVGKESLQSEVDYVAKQMANFSEGDHGIVVRSKTDDCQHLAVQANRMIEYVGVIDKQIATDYLPVIERIMKVDVEMATTIDRQTNDIARLSAELNNIVSGKTSGSAVLGGHLNEMKDHLAELSQRASAINGQFDVGNKNDSMRAGAHRVNQLQSHINDRLESLSELSQRINLDVVDASALLAGRAGGDRAVRRAVEQLQVLTARYRDIVNDVVALLADMNATVAPLLDSGDNDNQCASDINDFSQAVVSRVADIEQCSHKLLAAVGEDDSSQARQAESISLILDELQDGNQRLAVVAMDGDVGIKRLNKLASEHVKAPQPKQNLSASDSKAGVSS